MKTRILLLMIVFLGPWTHVSARNVDLATVPDRASVQLTIYNSEDLTLVRETRRVSFKKGTNTLQFSWANTLIDPTSVELRFLSHPKALEVVDTTYPHDKPQMLYWHVASELDGEGTVEITYFTSGITWSADYTAIADADESHLGLEGFVRVHNGSGERYENARVRLVVGTVNLVEKIATLARVGMEQVRGMQSEVRERYRKEAARQMMDVVAGAMAPAPMVAEKQIVKEGLSEYFIYTVEGTETIPDGWSKRLRSFHADAAPMAIEYRFRPREYGDHLVRLYLLRNDTASGLGTTPLPDGMVRVFRNDAQGNLSYLATQAIKYVPVGDRIELNLGEDPEVVFELVHLKSYRDQIWLLYSKPGVYKRLEDGLIDVDHRATVAGWDSHAVYAQRIRNYTERPIRVEVRRSFPGHAVFRSSLGATLHDYNTVQYSTELAAGQKAELLYEVVSKEGRNRKQNNVTLEAVPVPRPDYGS